jgi:glucan biosynthesis protein C
MKTLASPPENRLFFLDNLRYVMVICVVIFHTAVGYSALGEFYDEINTHPFFIDLRNFIEPFQMSVLFFIAGYFALPSLQNKSYGRFIKDKLWRLGLPWLLGVVFLGPLMPYMGYYTKGFEGLMSPSYWDFWISYIHSGFSQWVIQPHFVTQPRYHHQHFWFLSVLIQYFLVLTVLHALWRRVRRSPQSTPTPSGTPHFARDFILAALVMALAQLVMPFIHVPGGSIAFFFHFTIWNTLSNGLIFALGIYAYHRGWFTKDALPEWRNFMVVAIACILALEASNFINGTTLPGYLVPLVNNFARFLNSHGLPLCLSQPGRPLHEPPFSVQRQHNR